MASYKTQSGYIIWQANVTMSSINITPATDVLVNGCFNNFNTIACLRGSLLGVLALITGILCVLKLLKLHRAHHQNWHQFFIFYCATVECVIGVVHFVMNTYVQIDFGLQWLKLSQFLVMCHFYWLLATRALRREAWTKRFLLPFLVIASLYFNTVAILGIVEVTDTFSECFQPYWLMMSSAEFLIVQLFCVAGFYITRRLNEISTLDSVRRAQKRDLWCIVIVFEVSAFIGMLYDLVLRIIRSKEEGCSAVFNHAQTLFTVIFFLFMVAKLLAPIWVMLFVFQPTPQPVVENDDIQPALTEDGTSAFAATPDEHYRQLYHPSDGYRSLSYDTPTSRSPVTSYSPATLYAPINNPVGSINSIPNGIPSKTVRPGGPNLGIIREENQSATSSHSRSANKHTDSKSRRNEQHIDRHAFDNKGVETDIIAPKLPPPPGVVRSSSGASAGTQSHKSTGSQSTGAGTQSKNNGASTQSHVSIESQSTGAGNHSRNTGAGNQSYLSTGSQSSGTDTQSRNTRNGTQPLAPEQQPISDRRLAVSANGNHHIEDKEEGPKFVISSDDSDSSP